jgi:hypothetical protein
LHLRGRFASQVQLQRGDVVLVGSGDLFGHLSEAQVLTHIAATLGRAAASARASGRQDPWRALGGTSSSAAQAARGVSAALRRAWPWGGPPCGRLARELVHLAKRNWHRPTGDITAIAGLVR